MPYAARNEMATAIDLAIDSALSKEAADGTRPYVLPPPPTPCPCTSDSAPLPAPPARSRKTTSPLS